MSESTNPCDPLVSPTEMYALMVNWYNMNDVIVTIFFFSLNNLVQLVDHKWMVRPRIYFMAKKF